MKADFCSVTLGGPFLFCELKVYFFYKMEIIVFHIYYVTLPRWLGSCKIVFWPRGQDVKSELESLLPIKKKLFICFWLYQVLVAAGLGFSSRVRGLHSCGPVVCGILGMEPAFPPLAGGFFTTGSPGKSPRFPSISNKPLWESYLTSPSLISSSRKWGSGWYPPSGNIGDLK